MSNELINEEYICSFFGIETDKNGLKEASEIRGRLLRLDYQNGQDIIRIDDDPDGMYFLESGTAAVINREGKQVNVMKEGQCFGEYAVLAQAKRMTTVRSAGRTIVYRLSSDDLLDILHKHPKIYGEMMKKVYDQVSGKHSQLVMLSRMRRGILQAPENQTPLTPKRMLLQYGGLALLFLLFAILIPKDGSFPIFLPPLALMLIYVLLTKRTMEALIVSGMMAAMLILRTGLSASYADALIATMSDPGNAFTVLVMALMGAVVNLIEASGAVTAFKKLAEQKLHNGRAVRLSMVGIMAVTAIDDCLNMLCASTSLHTVADRERIPREEQSLYLSLLPTCLSSFIPFSLWGIFVVANINLIKGLDGFGLLCRSIPYNLFSLLVIVAMLALCFGKLPFSKELKAANDRVSNGGELWPEGSEKYIVRDDNEVWGKISNLMLPVAVLALSTLFLRGIYQGSIAADSACGLVATLIFMFLLYCAQGIMSPERFMEHLIDGAQSMTLPIMLYILSMCFSTLLDHGSMGSYLQNAVSSVGIMSRMMPAIFFLVFTFLTIALGSSWAMYAIAFPIGLRLAIGLGIDLPLCVGAICSAGIAGEKNCLFTSDSLSVGTAVGCVPDVVLNTRIPYSLTISILAFFLFLITGFIS